MTFLAAASLVVVVVIVVVMSVPIASSASFGATSGICVGIFGMEVCQILGFLVFSGWCSLIAREYLD